VVATAADKNSCDAAVHETSRVVFAKTPFLAGREYKVFTSLEAHTWGGAWGVAGAFAEIDFYGLKPDVCDKNLKAYKDKGVSLRNLSIIFETE
jgi:hypothetical protein